MITCKECNLEILRTTDECPRCGKLITFTQAEIRELEALYESARKNKEYEAVAEYLRILAGTGASDYEREWGRVLEKGDIAPRDYDAAMDYFLRAAKKCDPYSAYRYSRLVSRVNERSSRFWLLYSAVLSCSEAYPSAAAALSKSGNEDAATYYYILSAAHDDVDSIVELAARYYKGENLPQSSEYAKWYMDKLSFPPLYAFKLAYKLRGSPAKEPPVYDFDKKAFISSLADEALRLGFNEAYYKLNTMLADLGDINAMTLCAMLLADGVGCRRNIDEAIRRFNEAAVQGSRDAYLCLGKIFHTGEGVEADIGLAVRNFETAAQMDCPESLFTLGEIYERGELGARDYKKAEEYYRRAALLGNEDAGVRANEISAKREGIYKAALSSAADKPEAAFRGFAIAAAMGHRSAPLKLADCYLKGKGTSEDKHAAYYWYKTAAEAHDERALYPLGLCLMAGVGTNRDYKAARAVLERAAALGSEGAKIQIKNMLEAKKKKLTRRLYSASMRLIYIKKYASALDMLALAAELGEKKAYYTIGCMYEFGLGVSTDRIEAACFYEKSFRAGFIDSMSNYKKAILKLIRK